MRISFVGSAPWPPRRDQAGACIMVELGNGKRFFFDFGSAWQGRDLQRRRADAPAVLQVVGKRVDISIENAWGDESPSTRIVAIGAAGGFDAKALEDVLHRGLTDEGARI